MNSSDFHALSPLIVIASTAIIVMLLIAFRRDHALTAAFTLGGLGLSFALLFSVSLLPPHKVAALLIMDRYALFYMALIFAASFVVALLSLGYIERREGDCGEYYLLLLLATLGASALVASTHFVSFFMALELLSVALYGLLAYLRYDEKSIEAGVKYLVLAAVSSAFLLFGMALIYAELGTMEFGQIASRAAGSASIVMRSGLAMVIVGFGFKLAVVPFHLWTPDVYEGAPAPVTAFVATVSKGAVFALLFRFFTKTDVHSYPTLLLVFTLIAIASMFIGNLLALLQSNIKRILAYSSIAHIGYLLVAFLSSGNMALTAITYYLVAYFVTTLGAFGVVTVLSGKDRDADAMDDYQGLAFRRPWLAGVFAAMLLSLAGIPLTAGFVGKFYVLAAGAGSALWTLVIILIINSAIGLFYYLRIILTLYTRTVEKDVRRSRTTVPLSLAGGVVLTTLTLLLVWLGVYPAPLMDVIQKIAGSFY